MTHILLSTTVLTIEIDEIDVFQLKGTADLAKNESNTFITYTSGAFVDMSENRAQERLDHNALQAAEVIRDETPPELIEFSELDFTQNTLTLVFLSL